MRNLSDHVCASNTSMLLFCHLFPQHLPDQMLLEYKLMMHQQMENSKIFCSCYRICWWSRVKVSNDCFLMLHQEWNYYAIIIIFSWLQWMIDSSSLALVFIPEQVSCRWPEQVPCLSTKMVMCLASDLLNIQLEAFRSETFHIFLLATRDNCIGLFYL